MPCILPGEINVSLSYCDFFFFWPLQRERDRPQTGETFFLCFFFFSPFPSFYSLFIFQSDMSRESDSPAWKTHLESIRPCLAPSPSPPQMLFLGMEGGGWGDTPMNHLLEGIIFLLCRKKSLGVGMPWGRLKDPTWMRMEWKLLGSRSLLNRWKASPGVGNILPLPSQWDAGSQIFTKSGGEVCGGLDDLSTVWEGELCLWI